MGYFRIVIYAYLAPSLLRVPRTHASFLRMTSGNAIREMREAQGMSQRELAERAGVNHSYLAQVERGEKTNPSERWLEAVSKALANHLAEEVQQ